MVAGFSALELSEAFCRSHDLGPSQVPLVRTHLDDGRPTLEIFKADENGTKHVENMSRGFADFGAIVFFLRPGLEALLVNVVRPRIGSWC